MSYTLYTFPGHPKGLQCAVAAKLAGVDLKIQQTSIQDTKSEQYLSKHSLGKIPYLETPEGGLFETNAIIKYFGRKANLLGLNAFEEARVSQWLDWINFELSPTTYKLLAFVLGHPSGSEEGYKQGKAGLVTALKYLNDYLNNNSYLAGEQLTVADTSLICAIAPLMYTVIDEGFLKGNVAILRWYKHILSFDAVSLFYRKPFVTKKEWISVKVEQQKEKPKKEDKPKQQQQKQAKKEEKQENKQEEQVEAVQKNKNPLDLLPPSTFNLFDYKTFVVNEADKLKGVQEFWKQYDPQGYSIWHIKYDKYEGEGVKLFATSNLKDSFLQRLDHFRKYAFGTYGVYGDEGNYDVEGVWVWRGTEIPQEIKDLPNYEYHFWTKLDHTKEADKALLEEFWTNLTNDKDKVKGLTARDVQYFK